MVFLNSMRSIFRSMGKTTLFTLLILALTLVLSLGVSVWFSIEQFLDECNEFYTTIGLIEYMGTEYPGDTDFDPAMDEAVAALDTASLAADESVIQWEQPARALGYLDGYWRTDNYVPARGNSVFVVGSVRYSEKHKHYNALVIEVLYSLQVEPEKLVLIDGTFGDFEPGHYYLVAGEVYDVGSPLLNLRPARLDEIIPDSFGLEIPTWQDITAEEGADEPYIIPEDSVLVQVAETLQVSNNSLLVSGTDDLMALLPFHQEEQYITEGRAFTPEEYLRGDQVIVISELLSARTGLGLGDTIDLNVAIADHPGVYSSYWAGDGFSYAAPFEIVGITNNVPDKSWYVYVPRSAGVPFSPYPIGYTAGRVVLQNDDAAEFSQRIDPILNDRLKLTVYDQGYANVAVPFKTILRVSKIVTAVCFLVELAVIALFGFLFVYRQRETSETMLFLGSGRMRVVGHFLFSAGLIALVATSAGAVAGYYLHDGIIALVARAAGEFTLIDSRYSNGNLSISRTLEFAPHLEIGLFLAVGAVVFALTILACLAFVAGTFMTRKPSQRAPKGPRREGKTSHLGGGSLKYAYLSMRRGGARTTVVPFLAMAVVIFFGQLATTSTRYQDQLEAIYDNTNITGNYTDIKGKQVRGLVLRAYDVFMLYHSGYLGDLTVSDNEPYYYLGISRFADGTDTYLSPLYIPKGGFAAESLEGEILRGPDLTAINDIRTSPEFLYADAVRMTFAEGYDETFLQAPFGDEDILTCMIPSSLMAEKWIEFGDTIRVAINERMTDEESGERIFRHYDLKVVGSYEKQGARDTIYIPLSVLFDTSLIWGAGNPASGAPVGRQRTGDTLDPEQKEELLTYTFKSAHFALAETRSLGDLKEHLSEYGYSQVNQVGRVRLFLVLEDAAFNNSVASVKQQINYINTLYPFLYALVGIIALVVSYLLVVSRKVELAIMRGLGTKRLVSFFSFFSEQSLLCILGTVIGLMVWLLVWGLPGQLHLALTGGFLICYLIGSAISVTIMNHSNVLTILTDKD